MCLIIDHLKSVMCTIYAIIKIKNKIIKLSSLNKKSLHIYYL